MSDVIITEAFRMLMIPFFFPEKKKSEIFQESVSEIKKLILIKIRIGAR